jgi:hypothetical protein
MNLSRITYVPRARVEFLPEEVQTLFDAAQSHYDGHCKTTTAPTTDPHFGTHQCGLLTGLLNRTKNGTMIKSRTTDARGHVSDVEVVDSELAFRDLDTLVKIAESPLQGCTEIYHKLMTVLRHLNEASMTVSEFKIPVRQTVGDFHRR